MVRPTYEEIAGPYQQYRDTAGDIIEIHEEEGVGEDSEEDGVDKERNVTSGEVEVELEIGPTDVDAEDVDGDGALDHGADREEH